MDSLLMFDFSGFNMETVKYKNVQFNVFDLGGQTNIRPYWRCYYQYTDAVIYVVGLYTRLFSACFSHWVPLDSADMDRISISKQELVAMLQEEELKKASLLVFANKQDLEVLQLFEPVIFFWSIFLSRGQLLRFKCQTL